MEPAKSSSAQNIGLRTLVGILRKSFSASDLAGPITREQMKEAVERVSLALETPRETAERFAYYVSCFSEPKYPSCHHYVQSGLNLSR